MQKGERSGWFLLLWGLVLALWMAGSLWAMEQWPPKAVHLSLLDDWSLLGSFLSFAGLVVVINLFVWWWGRRELASKAEEPQEGAAKERSALDRSWVR